MTGSIDNAYADNNVICPNLRGRKNLNIVLEMKKIVRVMDQEILESICNLCDKQKDCTTKEIFTTLIKDKNG
ncbi:hypothetical protein M0R04_07855 [Candidatus Dojkabacteria bacterium]|nr:hypothetical protein [Candidatus Dojkabacteria bacterium]